MHFWARLDALLASHEVVLDRPRGTTHPRFPAFVYQLDYGYLQGTTGGDGQGIDVWKGTLTPCALVGVACTVDSLKGDAELKLLLGCTKEEMEIVGRIYSDHDCMSGIILRRDREGNEQEAAHTKSRRYDR